VQRAHGEERRRLRQLRDRLYRQRDVAPCHQRHDVNLRLRLRLEHRFLRRLLAFWLRLGLLLRRLWLLLRRLWLLLRRLWSVRHSFFSVLLFCSGLFFGSGLWLYSWLRGGLRHPLPAAASTASHRRQVRRRKLKAGGKSR
jgi:hypothetical protein